MGFAEVTSRMFALYGKGEFREALGVVRGAREAHPDKDNLITFWEACLLARIDQAEEAIAVLQAGLDRGQWWSSSWLQDPDLDPLRTLPAWPSLTDSCDEIALEQAKLRPQPIVRSAHGAIGSLVAIHGSNGNPGEFASTWEAAVPKLWTIVTPAGTEPLYVGGWGWPRSIDASARTVLEDVQELAVARPLVLTGFSIGSAIASQFILSGLMAVDGLIAVAPHSSSDFDELKAVAGTGLPMLILCGDLDPRVEQYRTLRTALSSQDRAVVEIVEGMGHQFPPDPLIRVARFLEQLAAE